MTLSVNDRLAAKCVREGECLIFTGAKNNKGYGKFWNGTHLDTAHRVAYRLSRGEIPDGAVVCHSCDRPACVEPSHLFLGTQGDNLADMRGKGRGSHGKTHSEAIKRGWTPELRAMRAEQTRAANAARYATRRKAAGVPDDWYQCADCLEWAPRETFKQRATGTPIAYCRPCNNQREIARQRRKKSARV